MNTCENGVHFRTYSFYVNVKSEKHTFRTKFTVQIQTNPPPNNH